MQVTATIDLQRQTQASLRAVRKHNEHDPHVKHSNVQIFPEDTEMNRHYDLLDFDKTLEKIYGDMINEKNKKLDEQFRSGKISFNRYNERKTNLKKWLNNNGKPRQAFTTWVLTLGNVESNLEIMQKLNIGYEVRKIKTAEGIIERPFVVRKDRTRWANYWAKTYREFATAVNNKDTGFKITAVDVHLDEGGAPHAHFESINCGKTVKGKISYNLNSAIKQSLEAFDIKTSQNSKNNLKIFRASYDPFITKLANRNAKGMMNVDLDLHTYRKRSKHKGLSMEEYKQRQATLTELSKSKQSLETNQAFLVQLQQSQKQLQEELKNLELKKKATQAQIDKVIAQAQSELNKIERQQDAKRLELGEIKGEVYKFDETRRKQAEQLKNEFKQLNERKQAMQRDIDELSEKQVQMHLLVIDREDETKQLQADIAELKKAKTNLQTEIAEARTLKTDKQRLLQERKELQQEVQELKSDVLKVQKVRKKEALELQQIRQQSSFVKNISDYERKLNEHLRQNPGKKMSSSRVIITNLQDDNGLER